MGNSPGGVGLFLIFPQIIDLTIRLLTSARRRSPTTEGVLMRGVFKFLVLVFLVSAFIAGRASGQGGATGAIGGVVVDSSESSVADAEVQITDSRTELLARKLS